MYKTSVLIEIMRNSFHSCTVINYFEAYAVELRPLSAESPLLGVYEKVLKYTIRVHDVKGSKFQTKNLRYGNTSTEKLHILQLKTRK